MPALSLRRGARVTHWGLWLHAVRPVAELAELAAAAEALGAAGVLVADEGTDRDLFVILGALAQRTQRMLLFGAVTNPQSRHPLALAAAYATLAELAPGRIVAGFGTGGSRVFGPMGLSPRRPYTALVECVDVVQALWRGETVDHHGEFKVRAGRLPWLHAESPEGVAGLLPALALAGRGPRVERLAAERADWILLAGRPVDSVPRLVSRLREVGVAARGRAPLIAWNPVAAWTDTMREELRAHLAYMAVDMPDDERAHLGLGADQARALSATVNTRGPSAAATLISGEVLSRYAIVGERESVVERLAASRLAVRPELLVFDVPEYSVAAVESIASVALDAGAAVFHNREALAYGLDSHDRS